MEDLVAGMTLFEDLSPNDQFYFQHPHELAVTTGIEWSEGHGSEGSVNCGNIGVAGPLTPRHAVGSVAKWLVTLPRVAKTPKSKEKGKGKAREEEEEEFKELVEDSFTYKCLAALLCWQKALTVVNMGMGAGVVLEKAKRKLTVLLEKQQAFRQEQGVCNNCWAENDPEGCWYPTGAQPCYCYNSTRKGCLYSGKSSRSTGKRQRELARKGEPIQAEHSSLHLPTLWDGTAVGGSAVAKGKQQEKSKETVESEDEGSDRASDNNDNVPLACKQSASPASVASAKQLRTVTSEEGEKEVEDVEMREETLLVMIAEVKPVVSSRAVESEEEVEAEAIDVEEDEDKENKDEERVRQQGTWSSTLL
ncbi:hypothetical protein E4T56_gene11872 [Termitomyces sp. T112]|nr:hypothetical protein E4T56_gene11872 [Termitomyces sp. T112]